MKKIEKFKKELTPVLLESPIKTEVMHAERTLCWLLVLRPDAELAMQIAAFGHDMERGITKITNKDLKDMDNYDKDREDHSLRSAKYLEQFLHERGYDSKLIEKVKKLVTRHEVGGDAESNLIKDADSISFFECNVPIYIQRNGIEKARFKIKYMFDRVTSNKAKGIIKNIKYSDPKIDQLVKELLNR